MQYCVAVGVFIIIIIIIDFYYYVQFDRGPQESNPDIKPCRFFYHRS